jgi:hypothetical protein
MLGRDPFARTTTRKRLASVGAAATCAWCGQRDSKGRLWCITVERDSIRGGEHSLQGAFCSVSCARSYHDL